MRSILALVLVLWCVSAHAQNITTTSFVGSTGSTNVSNSAVNYFALSGIGGIATDNDGVPTADSTVSFITNSTAISWTFRNLFCFSGAAPGAGKSYTVAPVVANGVVVFATTVTISDTATSASNTINTQSTAAFGVSIIAVRVTPAGTPTATTIGCYIEASVN